MKELPYASAIYLSRKINFLAKMAVNNNYTKDMIRAEIDKRFHNASRSDREAIFYKIVQKCYQNAWMLKDTIYSTESGIRIKPVSTIEEIAITDHLIQNCFAVKLSRHIIALIKDRPIKLSRDERFLDSFFSLFLNSTMVIPLFEEVADSDIFTIYLKQMAVIIRKSAIISVNDGYAHINPDYENIKQLYLSLFSSFWERVGWDEIFPSFPYAAKQLKRNRNFIIDLVLKNNGPFSIAEISNEFLELTGFSERNNLVLISFLDFYFFTWLRHFNLIEYISDEDCALVKAQATEHGKKFLIQLQNIQYR